MFGKSKWEAALLLLSTIALAGPANADGIPVRAAYVPAVTWLSAWVAKDEGYFDKLEVSQVKPFERDLFAFLSAKHPELLGEIKEKREISDDLRKRLLAALDQFQQNRTAA